MIDRIIAVALTVLIYVPGTQQGNLVRLAVALTAFFIVSARIARVKLIDTSICMIVSPIIAFAFVTMFEGMDYGKALFVHETIRMVFCATLLMVVSRLSLDINTLLICAVLALIPNLVIQVLEYTGNATVFSIIRQYYITDPANIVHLELSLYKGVNFRSGAVFVNPNVYMTIPMMTMCVFLMKDREKTSIINIGLSFVAALSGLLTGSRTATVVMVAILVIYLVKYASVKSKILFFVLLGGIFWKYGGALLISSRATQVTDVGSFTVKTDAWINSFFSMLENPLYLIVGALGSRSAINMDAEWGYIFSWYGLWGLSWYIKYYRIMWNRHQELYYYSRMVTIVCILISMTSSILLCMPIYSFVALSAFSDVETYYV